MLPLTVLEERIGYTFKNKELLRRAMTHRSFSAEHNERLEFLGDSVLNCVIGNALFLKDKHFDEGSLSRVRSNLVRQSHNLALQRFRHSGCRMIHHPISDFFRQVQPLSVLLQNFYNTDTLYVMLKSLRTYLIQNRFTGMTKRCMPQIVPQGNRFRQIFIES